MRLAIKMVMAVLAGTVLVLAIEGWYSTQHEADFLAADLQGHLSLLGHGLRDLTADVWRTSGETRVLELLADVNRGEGRVQARWVRLDGEANDAHCPCVPIERLGPLREGDELFIEGAEDGEGGCLYLYVPVALTDAHVAALELSASLQPIRQRIWSSARRTGLLAGVIALVSGVTALTLGILMVGRPLAAVTEKIRRIGAGDLSSPVAVGGHDELAELAAGLNEMCDQLHDARTRMQAESEARIEALEQLRHKDRLTTVGRLSSGLAHELGTPLNVVSGRATMIARGTLPPEMIAECANIVRDQCKRMTAIIQQLLDYARVRPPQRAQTNMVQLAEEVCGFLSQLAERQSVRLDVVAGADPCRTEVDGAQFQQVLTNLVMNAIQAMPDGGRVEVSVNRERAERDAAHDGPKGEHVLIQVRDQGVGIEEEELAHIFEPFFTTKGVGSGTGLGLSIAQGIVREHGGWIEAESQPGTGSRFSIYLPVEEPDARTDSDC